MSDNAAPRWEQPDESTIARWRFQAQAKAIVAQCTALGHAVGQNGTLALVGIAASVSVHRPVLGLAVALGVALRGAWQAGLALGERAEVVRDMVGMACDGSAGQSAFHARHVAAMQASVRGASLRGAVAGALEGARAPSIALIAVSPSSYTAMAAAGAAAITCTGSVDAVHARLDRDFEALTEASAPRSRRLLALQVERRRGLCGRAAGVTSSP